MLKRWTEAQRVDVRREKEERGGGRERDAMELREGGKRTYGGITGVKKTKHGTCHDRPIRVVTFTRLTKPQGPFCDGRSRRFAPTEGQFMKILLLKVIFVPGTSAHH